MRTLSLLLGLALTPLAASAQLSRITSTPHILQEGFGPDGEYLPNDGSEYCVPSAFTQALYWLRANGLTRVAPPLTPRNALNTDLAVAGFYNTTPDAGTGSAGQSGPPKILEYLALMGVADVSAGRVDKPKLADVAASVTGLRIGVINIAWVRPFSFERTAGHNVTVVATGIAANGQPAPTNVVINNPMSPTTQYLPTETLERARSYSGYLCFVPGSLGKNGVLPVIKGVVTLEPGSFRQPIAPYRPTSSVILRASGGTMGIWAPIRGKAGVAKSRASCVVFLPTSRGTWTGGLTLSGGSVVTQVGVGPALGRGDITLAGGTLEVAPRGARPRVLGTTTSRFRFSAGTVALRRSGRKSLDVRIAGRLQRRGAGSLLIAPSRGLASLGRREILRARMTDAELDDRRSVVPAILGSGPARGSFLRYDERSGFLPSDEPPHPGGRVEAGQELESGALRLDDAALVGEGRVRLRRFSHRHDIAGLILNGAGLRVSTLRLDARENVVLAGRDGGRIDSRIEGPGDLVITGPGELRLSGANDYEGTTFVNGGTLLIANRSGSATGTGSVVVRAPAVLAGSGRVRGTVRVEGRLRLTREPERLSIGGDAVFVDGSALEWTLQERGFPALQVAGDLRFSSANQGFQTLFLQFPKGGAPRVGDPAWQQARQWILAEAGGEIDASGLAIQNPRSAAGEFALSVVGKALVLAFTPKPAP